MKDNRLLWAPAVRARGGPKEGGAQDCTRPWPFRSSAAGWGWGAEWDTGQAEGVTWTDASSVLLSYREPEARTGAGSWFTSHTGPWEALGLPGLSLQASGWAGRRAWGTWLSGRGPQWTSSSCDHGLLSEAGEGDRPVPREAAPRHPATLWQPPRQAWECDWREQGFFPRESAAGCWPRPV